MSIKYVILRTDPDAGAQNVDAMGVSTGRRVRRGRPRAGIAAVPAARPMLEVDTLAPQGAANLARRKDVKCVAPVFPMKLIAPMADSATTAQSAGTVTWGVQAVGADTSPFTGDGIVVAVLDTGIDPSHAAFAGVEIVRRNFTSESDDDEHGHGTHCAGTIFGRSVGGTRIGVAPGVRKVLIGKVLGEGGGGSDRIAEAIQWAVNEGAHVISMSLGIDFPGFVKERVAEGVPEELATSMALEGYRANILLFQTIASFVAAQDLFMRPSLLVAAAGNESRRQLNPDFQIAVSPPAVADGFISVAAVRKTPQGFAVAPFSNIGARVSGPGVDVQSARRGGGLTSMSGTSMATPHVVGVAALWAQKLSKVGAFNARNLADRLVGDATTSAMAPGFEYSDVGAGLVQAPQS